MKRRAARVDANQGDVVDALRAIGCSVALTHAAGGGFPDLVVGVDGINLLIEVKDGKKPPSERKLTKDQVLFHAQWRGQIAVVKNVAEALQLIGSIRNGNH